MAGLTAVDLEASVAVSGGVNRPPMPESASAALMPLVAQVAPGLDGTAVGGGSDGNFTAAIGVPTLDGLGAIGDGAHAIHEHVEIDALVPRAATIAGLLARLLKPSS